jgi:nucleotide-binding universal stress UspA family protein
VKVLVAIDSSPISQRILEEIVARPWAADTLFCVVTAVDVGPFAELPALILEAKRECEKIVQAGAAILSKATHTATTQVLLGSPRRIISNYASEWLADLILVGSRGRGVAGRFFLGSAAQGILHTATCSVEIVRFPVGGQVPSSHPMKILFPTDGSAYSLAASHSLARRPWPPGSVCKILSVEELAFMPISMDASSAAAIYPPSLLEELIVAAHTKATGAAEAVKKILSQMETHVAVQPQLPTGDPRDVILDTAEAWPADLIVLGSHGRRGFDRFLMGSVAESVAIHASCSVEVIRPHEEQK